MFFRTKSSINSSVQVIKAFKLLMLFYVLSCEITNSFSLLECSWINHSCTSSHSPCRFRISTIPPLRAAAVPIMKNVLNSSLSYTNNSVAFPADSLIFSFLLTNLFSNDNSFRCSL